VVGPLGKIVLRWKKNSGALTAKTRYDLKIEVYNRSRIEIDLSIIMS
jgi:hypothetical protein